MATRAKKPTLKAAAPFITDCAMARLLGPKFAFEARIMSLIQHNWETGEEIGGKIFSPDTLISYEYFETSRRKLRLEPEMHLMQAILEDAIDTYRLHAVHKAPRQRRLFLDAQRWIMAHDENWPFSFENICSALGLDASFLRGGLQRWKERQEERLNLMTTGKPQYRLLRRAAKS